MKKMLLGLYLNIFSKPIMYRFNKILYILSLKGMGITNYQNYFTGELSMLKRLKKSGTKLENVFDVGANVGDYSLNIQGLFPSAKIFAFEPVAETYSILQKKCKKTKIKTYNLGLGEKNGESKIFYDGGGGCLKTASIFGEVEKKLKKSVIHSEKIKMVTIDSFVNKNKIEKIDFLKIDVEGNELSVLNGARKMISDKKISIIQFEFNEMNLVSKATFRDFEILLKDYNLYRILPKNLLKLDRNNNLETEIYLYQNILAILKSQD